jgi:hypothetical protein
MKKPIVLLNLAFLSFCPVFETQPAARRAVTELAPLAASYIKNFTAEISSFPQSFESFGIGTVVEEPQKEALCPPQESSSVPFPDQGTGPADDAEENQPQSIQALSTPPDSSDSSSSPSDSEIILFENRKTTSSENSGIPLPENADRLGYLASRESDLSESQTDPDLADRPDLFVKFIKDKFSRLTNFFEKKPSTALTVVQNQAVSTHALSTQITPRALVVADASQQLMTHSLFTILPAACALTGALILASKKPILGQTFASLRTLPQTTISRTFALTPTPKTPMNISVAQPKKPLLLAIEGPKDPILLKQSAEQSEHTRLTKIEEHCLEIEQAKTPEVHVKTKSELKAKEDAKPPEAQEKTETKKIKEDELKQAEETNIREQELTQTKVKEEAQVKTEVEAKEITDTTATEEIPVPKKQKLIMPTPRQAELFATKILKTARRNEKIMIQNFHAEARFRTSMAKFHAKDAKNKVLEIARLEKQAKNEVAKLEAELKHAEEVRIREQQIKETKAQEEAARLEQEEAARLKKQAEEEIARLETELKQVEEARVREEQIKQTKAQEDATALVKTQKIKTKKQFFPAKKWLPKINLRPLAVLSHPKKLTIRATTPGAPTTQSNLPELTQPTQKPTDPIKEEPKEEIKKSEDSKKETVQPKKEELENSTGKKLRKPEEEAEEYDEGEPLTKKIPVKKPAQKKEELPPHEEVLPTTPTASPHEGAKKALAPMVGNALAAARNGWASKITTNSTTPPPVHIPTTAELNVKAARQRTVELPLGKSDPAVKSPAIPNAHPESGFPAPVVLPPKATPTIQKNAGLTSMPIKVVEENTPDTTHPKKNIPGAKKAGVPPHEQAQENTHYPDIFPNLATKKEANTKLAFDFGKEIIHTTVIKPLKQLAQYVLDTINGWLS